MRVGVLLCGSDDSLGFHALRTSLAARFDVVQTFDLNVLRGDWKTLAASAIAGASTCDIVLLMSGPAFRAAFDVCSPAVGWRGLLNSIDVVASLTRALDTSGAQVILTSTDGGGPPAGKYPGVPWTAPFPAIPFDAGSRDAWSALSDFLHELAATGPRRPVPRMATEEELGETGHLHGRSRSEGPADLVDDDFLERAPVPPQRPPSPFSLDSGDGAAYAMSDGSDPFFGGLDFQATGAGRISDDDGGEPALDGEETEHEEESEPDPVLLGVTAPRDCVVGRRFNAVLAAYIEDARESAKKKLSRLGGVNSEPMMDLQPDRRTAWRVGAPVTIQLAAEGCDIVPAQIDFEWSGRDNIASFAVTPRQIAGGQIDLSFQVVLAGVTIARIPLPVLEAQAQEHGSERNVDVRSPRSAFASYASLDAEDVCGRLSALAHWAPGLEVFLDCLDLKPGESFKPHLREEIEKREAFLLFWSRRAAASEWVNWELTTAFELKRREAIIAMPLEDPKLALPPPQFADIHFRDRFLFARNAWAGLRSQMDANSDQD